MVSFLVLDLTFLVLFTLWVVYFLRKNRDRLGKEGIIFMYRTQVGVRAINWFGDKFNGFLKSIKYVVITVGFFLMGIILWMIGQTVAVYINRPEVTEVIKAPPIAPLIPYFPELFGLQSFFPPFYFTYFIVALAIVAFVHEFSHGIFMRVFKIKIKSTGVVFLGPILGAFVEQDDRDMTRKKNSEQMAVLGAGVFANLVFALLFYLVYVLFFFLAFSPAGYMFNSYSAGLYPANSISSVGDDIGSKNVLIGGFSRELNLTEVVVGNKTYYMDSSFRQIVLSENMSENSIYLFDKAPAIDNEIKGAITMANDVRIKNGDDLRNFMQRTHPGEVVNFTTIVDGEETFYLVELSSHPNPDADYGYIGVGSFEGSTNGFVGRILSSFMSFKDPSVYYSSNFDEGIANFFLYMFWWIMIINLLVALFNMLPLGILDGGRFFYLAVLSVTGSKKFAEKSFKYITYLIFGLFILMMLIWALRVF